MVVYTYSKARQKLAARPEQAQKEGEVRIVRRDGRTFIVRPEASSKSSLDVESLDLGITTQEIVQFIREGRKTP